MAKPKIIQKIDLKLNTADAKPVALSGNYSDLTGTPTIPKTASEVGARPSTWTPTAAEVGARPSTWMPTAADVGARPSTWTPTAADVGAVKKSTYTLPVNKGVRISYGTHEPILISASTTLGNHRLILVGNGYGESGTIRNEFVQLTKSTAYEWCLPPENKGLSSCVEIMGVSQQTYVYVWSATGVTFTEITALSTTNQANPIAKQSEVNAKADKASITAGTAGTSSATSGSTLAVPYVTMNAQGIVTGYGTHTHTVSGFAVSGADNNLIAHGNEFNFVPSGQTGSVYLNYRTAGGTNGNITDYYLGNGKGGYIGIALHTGNYKTYVTPANIGAATTSNITTYIGRTTNVTAADTNYTSYMVRGESLNAADTTPAQNGQIAWVYK